MTKLVADGRLQPYSIHFLEAVENGSKLLDPADFEKLLGSPAETLDTIYSDHKTEPFAHDTPHVMRYMRQLIKACIFQPVEGAKLVSSSFSKGWGLSVIDKTQ